MPKKILLVDDEQSFAEMLKIRLEANNYAIKVLTEATDISGIVEKAMPDLIILDIVMPGMDGYQVCKHLKNQEKTQNIPIILLTGKELEPDGIAQRCLDLGVEGYLFKPTDSAEIIAKIERVLAKPKGDKKNV